MFRTPIGHRHGWALPLALLVAVVITGAVGAPAQETDQETAPEHPSIDSDSGYFEEIAVEIVNVEVYVTDKQGRPIEGLTIDDFDVYEDDRPVEVVNFYNVSGGRPVSLPQTAASEAIDPLAEPGAEPAKWVRPDSQKLNLIVYVDNMFIHPLNRNRVFSRLRGFLYEAIQPGDQVMLASFDRSLHIRHPFTTNTDSLFRSLDELEKVVGFGLQREQERMDAITKIYETDSVHTAFFEASNFANVTEQEIDQSLDGLQEMLDSLAGLPGRKMLVHVSDGLPMVPGQDLYQAIQQEFFDQSALSIAIGRDRSKRYMNLTALANSNRVSFYTIDSGGLRTQSGMGAENRAIASPTGVHFAVEAVRTSNMQDTLIIMADRTGGQAIFNTNDVTKGLERFKVDLENYYSLGYRAPITDRGGRFHDIEVRLKERQKGLRIRHREGYRDKSIEAKIEDAIAAYFVHRYETNPLGAAIDLGPQTPNREGGADVAIRIRVPMANITLIPRTDFHEGLLRLYFSAVDQDGKKAPVEEIPLELRIPNESIELAKQDEVARIINLQMEPGPHNIVVGVRDELSEIRSVIGTYIVVGKTDP